MDLELTETLEVREFCFGNSIIHVKIMRTK